MDPARAQGGNRERSEQSREPDLRRRIRAAGWLLTTCIVGFALAEILARPGQNPAVSAVHLIAFGVLILLLAITSRPLGPRFDIAVAILALSVVAFTAAAVSVITGDANAASFIFVALAMGSAALLPWGAAPQAILSGLLLSVFVATIVLSEGHLSGLRLRELLGLTVILTASVYIAHELERSRKIAREEEQRRREREREIEQQRRFLRQVIDTDPHLVFAKDREGKFTLVNAAVAKIYGCTVDELIGRTDADFNPHPEEVAFFRAMDLRVFQTGQEVVIDEERITDASGEERWLQTIKRPLFAPDGSVSQVLGVATDITQQRRYRHQLEQEAYVAATLSTAAEQIIASLTQPELQEKLCAAATQAVGGKWGQLWLIDSERNEAYPAAHHLFSPELWEALRVLRVPLPLVSDLADRLMGNEIVTLDATQVRHSIPGFLLPLAQNFHGAVIIPLRRGPSVSGALILGLFEGNLPLHPNQERIARGVAQLASLGIETARVLAELEQASRLKSEFMATVSHELRTPLNVIIGYASLLQEGALGPVNPEQTDALSRLHANALQLLEMVNGILDLTRLETGRLPLEIRRVSLSEIVAAAVREVRQQLREDAVDVWCPLSPWLPPIETDPTKLKVVVKNLVSNAIKFTPAGWVRVTATFVDSEVQIAVEDTGLGIPPEEQVAIFEPFRQGRAATAQVRPGVGLGLYIVRRLVEVLGGRVAVDSQPGCGSTFVVRLPRSTRSTQTESAALGG